MPHSKPFVLGLDVGTNSIGWCVLACDADLVPTGYLEAQGPVTGVRIFDAGTEGDIASGRDESRNLKRRMARQQRRGAWRRVRRQKKILIFLQRAGLLPEGPVMAPGQRHALIETLDERLRPDILKGQAPAAAHLYPYLLRTRALDERLEPHALGRALYHLAQRRGFLSNRREDAKCSGKEERDEDLGKVKASIKTLADEIVSSGSRTLGEFFTKLNPEEKRIRARWTARSMFVQEFDAIWQAQARHYPSILNDGFRRQLRRAFFYQRPLKIQDHLIGKCELEPSRKRAPIALPECQRFRYLQRVNDLTYEIDGHEHKPGPDERRVLIDRLETDGDLTFAGIRKLLKLPRTAKFNLERGGEEKIPGNRTYSKLRKVFGLRWESLGEKDRDLLVAELRGLSDEAMAKRGASRWSLSGEDLEAFKKIALEDGHLSLSRKAVLKLLPRLEAGTSYATARKEIYPESFESGVAKDQLPPVFEAVPELRNPAVARALTELRKVVNAIVNRYGKPACIRVELARDLKKPRAVRKEIWQRNRAREKERTKAAERLLKEAGITNPKRADVLKVLLAAECDWQCPYTGSGISIHDLVGEHPKFEIEHIIPFAQCLDDSFLNKTLCYHEENRRKGKRPPSLAYGTEALEAICQRVAKFKGDAKKEKLRRFKMTTDQIKERFEGFTNRQLNDTAYISRLAMKYLGYLYGGRTDEAGRLRIQVGAGQATAFLRNELGLNAILDDGGEKTRIDHRHHAVDAAAVGLTAPRVLKALSEASARAADERRRLFGQLEIQWTSVLDDVRERIESIVVSHRVDRKVSGPLHQETYYSRPVLGKDAKEKEAVFHHVRKSVADLTSNDLDDIVDPVVKARVLERLEEAGGLEPKDAFKEPKDHPWLKASDGRRIPIHKVRLKKKVKAQAVGSGPTERFILPANNHHVEIVATTDIKGKISWEGHIVTLLEAVRRKYSGEPVVNREHGNGKRFVCSIGVRDSITVKTTSGAYCLLLVRSISPENDVVRFEMTYNEDARDLNTIKKSKNFAASRPIAGIGRDLIVKKLHQLQELDFSSVRIGPLGEVHPSNV